jgi:hypothetical protein
MRKLSDRKVMLLVLCSGNTDAIPRLRCQKHFLKGGGKIQLRMKLFLERIEEIKARFRLAAKLKYISGIKDNSIKVGGRIKTQTPITIGVWVERCEQLSLVTTLNRCRLVRL